jgi:hypothetical protein
MENSSANNNSIPVSKGTTIVTPIKELNTTHGVAGELINSFIHAEMQNKGRLESMQKKYNEEQEHLNNLKELQGIARLSSGALVVRNHPQLDCKVRDISVDHLKGKIQAESERQKKIEDKKESTREKFVNARDKYIQYNQQERCLNTSECLTLLRYTSRPNDPPIGRSVGERRTLLDQRRQRVLQEEVLHHDTNDDDDDEEEDLQKSATCTTDSALSATSTGSGVCVDDDTQDFVEAMIALMNSGDTDDEII